MVHQPAVIEAEKMAEEPYDASDPVQVNKARKKSSRQERERLEFVQGMMTLPQGRKWLWQLMESCYIFSNPVVLGDTHATYENLGRQNIGKALLTDAMQFSEDYVRMAKEAKDYSN